MGEGRNLIDRRSINHPPFIRLNALIGFAGNMPFSNTKSVSVVTKGGKFRLKLVKLCCGGLKGVGKNDKKTH